jgi:putative oligomerization/nucleic acid binding protein
MLQRRDVLAGEQRTPRAESFPSVLVCILFPVAWATVLSACESTSPVISYEYRPQLGYVRIERIEAGAPDNAHPFNIPEDVLRQALASLELEGRLTPVTPVFDDEELAEIVPHLSAALAKAAPKEDVTFAVTGRHGTFGAHSPRTVTTGRLFVRERQLNVVFGLVHQPYEQRYQESPLGPGALSFPPGSRAYRSEGFWKLAPKAGHLADKRVDWVMLDTSRAGPAAPVAPSADSRYEEIQNRLSVLNRLKADGLITEEEYGERRRAILQGL